MIFRRLDAVPDFLSATSSYLPPPSLHVFTFLLNCGAFCIRIFAFFVHNIFAMFVVFRSLESLRWRFAMGWSPSSCVCDVRRPSFVVRSPLTSSPQKQVDQSELNLVWSICWERRKKLWNLRPPSFPKGRYLWVKNWYISLKISIARQRSVNLASI